MGIIKQQIVQLLIKLSLLFLITLLCASCDAESGIEFEYPDGLKFKQDLEHTLFVKVENKTNETLIIDGMNASCNCLINENQFPMKVDSKEIDLIKVKIFANRIGENLESVVVYHNFKNRFENIRIRYEVY
jgi:hypothetical protein